jgi:3-methyl-2-oxobutanoate hydroxymethyltransferase
MNGGMTTQDVRKRKGGTKGIEKLVMTTCYDATWARLVAGSGVDMVLVGDSLGMVIQGRENTLPVTLDDMIYHGRAVARGFRAAGEKWPHLTIDMPFGTYQQSPAQALKNATRVMKEVPAESIKLEGGLAVTEAVRRIVAAGIPVMGHVGLTPQSVQAFGGHRVQGRETDAAERIFEDAVSLERAGCYCVVLEGIPTPLAERITRRIAIPTIGIGAGPHCDGQVLVLYDLLGLSGPDFKPKFLKRYADLHGAATGALATFAKEVKDGTFPDEAHSYSGGTSGPAPTVAYSAPGAKKS